MEILAPAKYAEKQAKDKAAADSAAAAANAEAAAEEMCDELGVEITKVFSAYPCSVWCRNGDGNPKRAAAHVIV